MRCAIGAFEVHRIAWPCGTLDELLVSFEQHCPGLGNPGAAALQGVFITGDDPMVVLLPSTAQLLTDS